LGVSLTGIYDHISLSADYEGTQLFLEELREYAREVNREWADKLGINPSAAITTVKPSGTVSQLVDSASGIHPRHSQYYIRSIRQDNKDPLTAFMKDNGIPHEPDITKPDATTVFYFPMKAPEGAITRGEVTPEQHLNLWKVYNEHWAEHQVSVTVSIKEDEWLSTGAWVYKNFDHLSGVSFLPMDLGTYQQAPYQECTKEEYEAFLEKMPKELDWDKFPEYEQEDNTTATRELACTAGYCEI
jgi:ribonucleoside-diphosphate reductase alpha chain